MVNRFVVPLLAIGLFLGVIGGAVANGNWIVSGKEMVDVQNLVSGAEVKGWMTLQQVADGFAIPPADLYTLSGIPADMPMETALKDLEGVIEGFEIALLREEIDAYLGASSPPVSVTPAGTATQTATEAATSAPTPTPLPPSDSLPAGISGETETHLPKASGAGDGTGPTPLPPGEILAVAEIKGKHTLAEIAEQTKVPLDALLAALDLPAEQDPAATVRDLMNGGLIADVDAVRSAVTDLQSARVDN
jgi:hypothetical protein